MARVYPWYEITEDPQLAQGDVVTGCPILMPPQGLRTGSSPQDSTIRFKTYDVVVMSQSCDIQQGNIELVLVCPYWAADQLRGQNSPMARKENLEQIRKGNRPGYHMLAACELDGFESECRVVGFRDVYSVHLDFLQDYVALNPRRLRLLPPYREHLSQAFARFFMRVGLPVDIPSFTR